MAYKLRFHELAWAEWQKLDGSIKTPLKKETAGAAGAARVPSAALSGMADCYKIKLRQAGYRLICSERRRGDRERDRRWQTRQAGGIHHHRASDHQIKLNSCIRSDGRG